MRARFDFSDAVIVITGGANGIGAALASGCAQAGAKLIVADVDEAAMEKLASAHPSIEARRLDVSDRGAVFDFFASIKKEFGRLDGLVCAAAIQPRATVESTSEALWRRVLDINLNGVVWCCQAALPLFKANGKGAILMFTSGLASSGWPEASAYATSKAGLIAFGKSLARELVNDRIRVNVVAPGVIDTPQFRAANQGADASHWASTTGIGVPEDVVGPLMFLLSDQATMTASMLTRETVYRKDPS